MRSDDPNLEYLIVEELKTASDSLQRFVRDQFKTLLSHLSLENYLPGLLADEGRAGVVLSRIRSVVG